MRAVFIDRDGVINEMVDRGEFRSGDESSILRYSAPWKYSEFELLPRVKKALVLLGQLGLVRVLVTNQPDIAYGRLSLADHAKIMAIIEALSLDDIYVCSHRSQDQCCCKKPKPGMLLAAARKWSIDLESSFIIGDTSSDMEAGRAAGCKTVLISTSYNRGLEADFYADSFFGAAKLIQEIITRGRIA